MDKDRKLELATLICTNAEELIEEAQILLKEGRIKRALFLTLTSYEEIAKAKMILDNPENKAIYKHRSKYDRIDKIISLVTLFTSAEYLKGLFKNATLSEETKTEVYGQIENIQQLSSFLGSIDMMTLRNDLLYVDWPALNKEKPKSKDKATLNAFLWLKLQEVEVKTFKRFLSELHIAAVPQA